MRNYLLRHYTDIHPQSTIIGHHSSVHLRNFFTALVSMGIIRALYELVNYFFPSLVRLSWIAIAAALVVYGRFLFTFFDLYLDALIIDKNGVTILLWNKIFNYSLQHSHRDHIEDIQQSQRNFSDKFFAKGNITITLNNGKVIRFAHVAHPKKITRILRDAKVTHETPTINNLDHHTEDPLSSEKFDILVETLGEVIKDYMERDQSNEKKR